jgi:hypothetical protein
MINAEPIDVFDITNVSAAVAAVLRTPTWGE